MSCASETGDDAGELGKGNARTHGTDDEMDGRSGRISRRMDVERQKRRKGQGERNGPRRGSSGRDIPEDRRRETDPEKPSTASVR